MKAAIGRLARALVPRPWHRSARLERWLRDRLDERVVDGPFAGLRYGGKSFGSAYWPKRLGTYELELRRAVARELARAPDVVLVAGAAEGYYAVGLALGAPGASVVAWEANPEARAELEEMAARNGVRDRIEIRGICDAGELSRQLERAARPLLVADLDSGETVLLDPELVPALARTAMIVETHDCFVPGTSELLGRRFAASHEIELVVARPRTLADAPRLDLPEAYRGALVQLLSECRPPGNDWLVLVPRRPA